MYNFIKEVFFTNTTASTHWKQDVPLSKYANKQPDVS